VATTTTFFREDIADPTTILLEGVCLFMLISLYFVSPVSTPRTYVLAWSGLEAPLLCAREGMS